MGFFFGAGFDILFYLVFFLILGIIIFTVVRGFGLWNRNNHSPRLTVGAVVTAKRAEVSGHGGAGNAGATFTHYYVTFEVESGDRMELSVSGQEYGQLVEGDSGYLSFQGTRFLGFERQH